MNVIKMNECILGLVGCADEDCGIHDAALGAVQRGVGTVSKRVPHPWLLLLQRRLPLPGLSTVFLSFAASRCVSATVYPASRA